jgi:hypothetical protein
MADVRKASLAAHVAARAARDAGYDAAGFAARAAGQAVATAHVADHAKGAAAYAVKAAAVYSTDIDASTVEERDWQSQRLMDLQSRP